MMKQAWRFARENGLRSFFAQRETLTAGVFLLAVSAVLGNVAQVIDRSTQEGHIHELEAEARCRGGADAEAGHVFGNLVVAIGRGLVALAEDDDAEFTEQTRQIGSLSDQLEIALDERVESVDECANP